MKEYQKIETLYRFNSTTKKFDNAFYNPMVEYLSTLPWIVSEKFDGTNVRVHYDGHKVEWFGRADDSELPKEAEALLSKTFQDSEIIFEQLFQDKDVILFMECYGGKIQGGIYGGQERLIGFDVMVNNIYLNKMTIKDIFDKFGIECVRFEVVKDLSCAIEMVKSEPPASHNESDKPTIMEGLVCVPLCRLYDHQGHRIAVKIKARDLRKMN